MTEVFAVTVGAGLMFWTMISVAIVLGIITAIALIARALFRRGRIKK